MVFKDGDSKLTYVTVVQMRKMTRTQVRGFGVDGFVFDTKKTREWAQSYGDVQLLEEGW
jgi:hypothetical protein